MKMVSIVIPVFRREDVFPSVALLQSQPYASNLRFVVVDNGNEAELAARLYALRESGCDVVRFEENRGGSAAYIEGMRFAMERHSETDVVWLLDDDAHPNAETLPALVRTMERLVAEDPKTASVGSTILGEKRPDVVVECGAGYSPLLMKAFPRLKGRSLASVGDVTLKVPYAAACSLLVRKEAVRVCGFWEDLFLHLDDIEWGLRVTKAGWHNYATTTSTVIHPEFDAGKSGAWVSYYDSRNQYWLAEKYGWMYLLAARLKNAIKNFVDIVLCRHPERVPYRRLAWRDFRAGIRRLRADLVAVVDSIS